jgi:hypothetical protein
MLEKATCDSGLTRLSQPGFGGNHHLPPYSILYASSRHLHPNGFLSQDSQGGVPKLPRFGLSQLCDTINLCLDLWLGRGLKKNCSSCWELFNGVLHSTCTHRAWVNSWLLVVGNQTASLTPILSFHLNLCWRCPNESCEPLLNIYTSINFQWYK